MEKINSIVKGNVLTNFLKSAEVRSTIINIFGKIFHEIISKGNISLEDTAKSYLKRNNFDLKVKGEEELEKFKQNDRGIIIANHYSGNFADYLPIFAELGDEILKKSIFYTGAYNKRMNQREFPDYTFRAATLERKEDVNELIENIESDIERVHILGGYIFIIPAGDNTNDDAEFKSIFKRFIKGLDDNINILASKVIHDGNPNYVNILKGKGFETKLVFKNMEVSSFKGKTGKEMRKIFNENLNVK